MNKVSSYEWNLNEGMNMKNRTICAWENENGEKVIWERRNSNTKIVYDSKGRPKQILKEVK